MAEIALEGVCKVYANGACGLVDCDLKVAAREWLVLVGPSGCGKTTTLRLIAGLEEPTRGVIRIGNKVMNGVPPARRNVAMVFQRPALFPNKTVAKNLAFGLRLEHGFWGRFSKVQNDGDRRLVGEVAECLGISHLLERRPEQLSGGEQQRVALGRALIRRTPIGLLDEPLGQLDAPMRLRLRRELPLLRSRFPATMIIVTHDPAEALALGDRVGIIQDGKILQVDRPEVVRQRPSHPLVAEFFRDIA